MRWPLLLAVAALGVAVVWLVGIYLALGRRFAFPLDDSYIHLQYAKELAGGHPFLYGAGDGQTTGATSTLWPVLLVPGFWLGGITAAIVWTLVLQALLVAGTVVIAFVAARSLGAGTPIAVAASLTILANGWFLENALSGMESALIAFGVAVVLWALVEGRTWLLVGGLVLTALTRPEGAVATVVICIALFLTARPRRSSKSLVLLIPIAAAIGQALVWHSISGRFATDTAVAKSVFYDPSLPRPLQIAAWLAALGRAATQFVVGTVGAEHHPREGQFVVVPFLAVALAAAGAVLAWRGGRRSFVIGATAFAGSYLVIAASADWASHGFRYLTALLPVLTLAAVPALAALASRDARAGTWPAATLVVASACGLPLWFATAQASSAEMAGQDVWLGQRLPGELPEHSRIAIHDAGALKLYSGFPHFDLLGLVSPGEALSYREGIGAVVERMERLPPGSRPSFFVMWPNLNQQLVGTPYVAQELDASPDLGDKTDLGGPVMAVFSTDWSSVERAEHPPGGGRVSSSLDVGDLTDEGRASYEFTGDDALHAPGVDLVTKPDSEGVHLAEGCRSVVEERFGVPTGGRLIGRFASQVRAEVRVDDAVVGTLQGRSNGGFVEARASLPAGGTVTIRSLGGSYESCHYWEVGSTTAARRPSWGRLPPPEHPLHGR